MHGVNWVRPQLPGAGPHGPGFFGFGGRCSRWWPAQWALLGQSRKNRTAPAGGFATPEVDQVRRTGTIGRSQTRRGHPCPRHVEQLSRPDAFQFLPRGIDLDVHNACVHEHIVYVPAQFLVLTAVTGQPCCQPAASQRAPHIHVVACCKAKGAQPANGDNSLLLDFQEQGIGAAGLGIPFSRVALSLRIRCAGHTNSNRAVKWRRNGGVYV